MPLEVYYVDDEPQLCEIFREYFHSPEVNVTTFTAAESAVEAITERAPDLLLIDYRLPGTTAEQVMRRLEPQFPVVLITGEISIKPEYPYLRTIFKPFDEVEIRKILDSVESRRVPV